MFTIEDAIRAEPCIVYKIILFIAYPRGRKDLGFLLDTVNLLLLRLFYAWLNNITVIPRDG